MYPIVEARTSALRPGTRRTQPAGARPTSSAAATPAWRETAATTAASGCRERVFDVARHLRDTVRAASSSPIARNPGEPLFPSFADVRGDGARVVERRRRRQLDVEGDERRARGDERHACGVVRQLRAEVRDEVPRGHPRRQLLDPAAPQLGARAVSRQRAVEEDGQTELLREEVARDEGLCARGAAILGSDVDDRRDVHGANARVDAVVAAQVDAGDRLTRAREQRGREHPRLPGERVDGAVVVGIGMDVEQPDAGALEGAADGVDRRGVTPLGDVGDGEQGQARPS